MLRNKNKGITLVALVITIIILLILAGISISALTNQGLFANAKRAKEESEIAQQKEQNLLSEYEQEFLKQDTNGRWDGKVNKPELMTGMSAIKFTEPTDGKEGTTIKTTSDDTEWYNYDEKKWANAKTEDGSMWVWIPRYAYKVVYNDPNDKSKGGKFDIVFLIGTTDNYYENGEIKTAQRQASEDQTIETDSTKTDKYTVHPAFTNESKINYANGGWDKELAGIWVAKFEAGYASGNNTAPVKASSVNYSHPTSWVPSIESGEKTDSSQPARNWLDNEYVIKNGTTYEWKEGKETSIKYPTFQGITYSMNYIVNNDVFNISRKLTEKGNIYGLKESSTDSHLMKNSEWVAVAYLSQSKYGLDGENIVINNVVLNNSTTSVYAVTGCAGETADAGPVGTTIKKLNDRAQNGIYVWTQEKGTKASSTGTIYGIYDLSGGVWERTAAIVNNGNDNLSTYGSSILSALNNGKSSKYVTVYPYDSSKDNKSISSTEANSNVASTSNYKKNTKIYGDAIRETSVEGDGKTSWYSDYSGYAGLTKPFFNRGGAYWSTNGAGIFSCSGTDAVSAWFHGFRVVLVYK